MLPDKRIGRKVWLLQSSLVGYTLVNRKEYTFVSADESVYPPKCTLKDDDGKLLTDIDYYAVKFVPEGDNIYEYLALNGLYADVYVDSLGQVSVDISWGDWKHEHLYCKWLMGLIGYELSDETVTEDDGQDCYSSTHVYVRQS